jgi:hypothetical protein
MTTTLDRRLARLAPVSLAELDAAASLQVRRDRKYLVPVALGAELVARLGDGIRVLEIDGRRRFRYESVYYDTPDLASYLAAARRRPRRFKVRTRTYLDSGQSLLEVKTRDGRGRTVKERHGHPAGAGTSLARDELRFLAANPMVDGRAASLRPVLVNRYDRSTLLLDGGGGRVTIDIGLAAATDDGRSVELAGTLVVETKSPGAPGAADRILWELGVRPTRISKFCTSLAAMHPDLPGNRWTQALRRPWVTGAAGLRLPPAMALGQATGSAG